MKKILLLLTVMLFMVYASAMAQTVTPKSDVRQGIQQARIAQGVRSGDLTRAERRALKTQQRHIRRVERRAKSDGVVTPREKSKINRKQNRANRNIRRQKNDGDKRNGA